MAHRADDSGRRRHRHVADVETAGQRRSRIAQRLNVQDTVRLASLLAAALLTPRLNIC